MADYDILLPEVLPEVPGCSMPLAIREIRNATIELCKLGMMVKQTVTAQTVTANDPYVSVSLPAGSALIHLREMTLDGFDVRQRSTDALDLAWRDDQGRVVIFEDYRFTSFNPNPDGWRTIKSDRPCAYYLEVDDAGTRIRLVGIPTKAFTTLDYVMVLKPARDSTGFATWVLDEYFKTIADGAIANLLALPKKPWTDMATAAVYRSKFNEGVSDAAADGARDFTRDDETTGRVTSYV